MSVKLSFSGHETFHCRHFWLKKGYDFLAQNHNFTDDTAVVTLGVGKNMVSAIRFWMRAFGLVDEKEQLTEFAHYIFAKNGKDPYLENLGTLWLLHYHLVKTARASIYSLIFNEFRRERREFNKEHIRNFLKRKCRETETNYNINTVQKDIGVFFKNYLRPKNKIKNIEDDFSAILIDLDFIQEMSTTESNGYVWYKLDSTERDEIPKEILLFGILDIHKNTNSMTLQDLLNGFNSVGSVFAINANGLFNKIEAIVHDFPSVVFKDDAGNRVLQIKSSLNKWDILNKYYAS